MSNRLGIDICRGHRRAAMFSASLVALFCGGMAMQAYRQDEYSPRFLTDEAKAEIKAIPASMFEPKEVKRATRMIDHAQAKTNLIDAAIKAAEGIEVKAAFPLEAHELERLKILKRAVDEYKKTKQPKRDHGDDFDFLHGTS